MTLPNKSNIQPQRVLSDREIIELIRKRRNDLIKDLLNDDVLLSFLKTQHQVEKISEVKMEFIKRTLKEFLISPVDLVHYGQIILAMRTSVTAIDVSLFNKDIGAVIKGHIER
jgi:hypothetical protein